MLLHKLLNAKLLLVTLKSGPYTPFIKDGFPKNSGDSNSENQRLEIVCSLAPPSIATCRGTSSVKPNKETTCFDTERLHVRQTKFSPEIEFELRTFRFASGTDPGQQQEQEFSCLLHIEDQSTSNTEQQQSCSCYTEAGFQTIIFTESDK